MPPTFPMPFIHHVCITHTLHHALCAYFPIEHSFFSPDLSFSNHCLSFSFPHLRFTRFYLLSASWNGFGTFSFIQFPSLSTFRFEFLMFLLPFFLPLFIFWMFFFTQFSCCHCYWALSFMWISLLLPSYLVLSLHFFFCF